MAVFQQGFESPLYVYLIHTIIIDTKSSTRDPNLPRKTLFEACVETTESAAAAQKGGADRIELCVNLDVGGTTPPKSMIAETRRLLSIPIHVLIRPREGDFCYSNEEFELMKSGVLYVKETGMDGIVVGILNHDRTIDVERTRILTELARPMGVTFHRAFDETPDPRRALQDIINIGVERLLTSGQKPAAREGLDLIRELVQRSGDRLIVMPGGGVKGNNARGIIDMTGVREIHASLREPGEMAGGKYAERVMKFVDLLP
jgi:copper homeostasis protein